MKKIFMLPLMIFTAMLGFLLDMFLVPDKPVELGFIALATMLATPSTIAFMQVRFLDKVIKATQHTLFIISATFAHLSAELRLFLLKVGWAFGLQRTLNTLTKYFKTVELASGYVLTFGFMGTPRSARLCSSTLSI